MSEAKAIIYFRADGNLETGYGHVIRSLALLNLLKGKFECCFLIHRPDEFLVKEINKTNASYIDLPAFDTLEDEARYIAKHVCKKTDWVVLDGYKFTSEYQYILKSGCDKLVSIDDIYQTHFYADVIINHSEGILKQWYQREWYTTLCLGARYALLRKPFLRRATGYALKKNEGHRVFINLGGTDPQNYTMKALRLGLKIPGVSRVDIVVGALFPFQEAVRQIIQKNRHVDIRLHINVDAAGMARLMKKSSIGICAASSVSYEYARVGGVLFLYQTVSNQKNIYASFVKGAVAFAAATLLKSLPDIEKKTWLKKYFAQRERFFEGSPAKNLKRIFDRLFLETKITSYLAGEEDGNRIYTWGEKKTRAGFACLGLNTKEEYQTWYQNYLKNPKAFTYLFWEGKKLIGLVYIEQNQNNSANFYVLYDEVYAQGVYSEIILRKAIFMIQAEDVYPVTIRGIVEKNDSLLLEVFQNCGFEKESVSGNRKKTGEKYTTLNLSFRQTD
jgi:UDP-2,4-diacetamido-2,4,6-trideoxy-beta-L-altropyranose hydrolase